MKNSRPANAVCAPSAGGWRESRLLSGALYDVYAWCSRPGVGRVDVLALMKTKGSKRMTAPKIIRRKPSGPSKLSARAREILDRLYAERARR